MDELGVEMIPGYSPQARGRGERWNGTWQGRLSAELRKEGIDNISEANRYGENYMSGIGAHLKSQTGHFKMLLTKSVKKT